MRAGQWLTIALAGSAVIGGAAIFYLQSFVHYQQVAGLDSVRIGAERFAVRDYVGLDNPALPLRLRGCFSLEDPAGARAAGPAAEEPAPFEAPFWFDCWDAAAIDADLKAGRAHAVLAERAGEGDFETERIVVVYPDGRAYQWRRLKR